MIVAGDYCRASGRSVDVVDSADIGCCLAADVAAVVAYVAVAHVVAGVAVVDFAAVAFAAAASVAVGFDVAAADVAVAVAAAVVDFVFADPGLDVASSLTF